VPPSPPSGEGQYAIFLILFPLSSCWRGARGEVFEGLATREFEEDTVKGSVKPSALEGA